MQVASLHVYPVKSMDGGPVADFVLDPWGPRHDRRWMVVDPAGEVITASACRSLLGVSTAVDGDGAITLNRSGSIPLTLSPPADGPLAPVGLSRLDSARDAGPVAADWVSQVIGRPGRLVWLDDPRRRPVGAKHGGRPGDVVSLADTGPVLLTTEESLELLDNWVAETAQELGESVPVPLSMDRFRPNVVVSGAEPFVEDAWGEVRLGDVLLRAAELCDRCVVTTIDPLSRAGGKEPIRTLARRRRWDGAVWFGIRLIPTSSGTVRVGDPVTAS